MFPRSLLCSLILSACVQSIIYSEDIKIPEEISKLLSALDFPLTRVNQDDFEKNYGLLHNAAQNIVIANDKQPKMFICKLNTTDGGVINCRSCSLINNTQPIFFGDNKSTLCGGAIYSAESVILSKNSRIIFYQNTTLNQTNSSSGTGGAIQAKNFEASLNKETLFSSNLTKVKGGAIASTEMCRFFNNSASIHFDNNRTTNADSFGGAISAVSCEFARNRGKITFSENKSGKGGAICSTTSTRIVDNQAPITFSHNVASNTSNQGNGGAINSPTIVIENNKQPVLFSGNSSAHAGGALSYQHLTIQNNGPVYFLNNTSCWGAACYGQTNNGTTTISADYGDVIFDNNIAIDRMGVWRSAMHFSSNHSLSLGASSNQHIYLFDRMNTGGLSSFIINPEDKHTGAVVFSAASTQLKLANQSIKNLQISYKGELTIKHGIVSVEDGAILWLYKFTPEDNTHLCLGSRAIMQTQENSSSQKDSNLQLKNVAILLTDILKPDSSPPTVWIYPGGSGGNYTENTDARISISGSLSLWNKNYSDPYDSVDLSQPIDRIPLLHLSEPANNSVTIDDFDVQAINAHKHYGHQGIWTPYWEEVSSPSITSSLETTNSKHRYLYANWTPTGYVVNPQHRGDLVANTLRQTARNAMAFYPALINDSTSFYLEGNGLASHTRQRNQNEILGFSSRSLGYGGECLFSSKTQHKFLLTFSQLIGKIKEHTSNNKVSSHSYLLGATLQTPQFNDYLITTASLGYGYGDHHMQSFYAQNKTSETQFSDHVLSARIGCYTKLPLLNHHVTPFIQLAGVRAKQTQINETGDFSRKFSNQHPLVSLTLPVGILASWHADSYVPSVWEFELAYQPLVYEQKPKVLITLLASNGSWISSGTAVARHNLHVEGRNSAYLFHNIVAFLNYHLDLSSSTTSHYINAGSRVVF